MSTSEADHLVKARRQPGDYRLATYPLERVYRMRWDNVGGGIQQRSAMHVYDEQVWPRILEIVGPKPQRPSAWTINPFR